MRAKKKLEVDRLVARMRKAYDDYQRKPGTGELFSDRLLEDAQRVLMRVRRNRELTVAVMHSIGVMYIKRWKAVGDTAGAVEHDLSLLYIHSLDTRRPARVFAEAEVLRHGHHLPSVGQVQVKDRRFPFTECVTIAAWQLVRRVPFVRPLDVLERLADELFDQHLAGFVRAAVASLGGQPSPRQRVPAEAGPSAAPGRMPRSDNYLRALDLLIPNLGGKTTRGLDEAIRRLRQELSRSDLTAEYENAVSGEAGVALQCRFLRHGRRDDLAAAIKAYRHCRSLHLRGNDTEVAMVSLSQCLFIEYGLPGDPAGKLDLLVEATDAVETARTGGGNVFPQSEYFFQLGSLAITRFIHAGLSAELDNAVFQLRMAAHPERVNRPTDDVSADHTARNIMQYASALLIVQEVVGSLLPGHAGPTYVDEALQQLGRVEPLIPRLRDRRLARQLGTEVAVYTAIADGMRAALPPVDKSRLDGAIDQLDRARTAMPRPAAGRAAGPVPDPGPLSPASVDAKLAMLLVLRARQHSTAADLDRAIRILTELPTAASGFGLGVEPVLAEAHWLRHRLLGDAVDAERALAAYGQVAANPAMPSGVRLPAATRNGLLLTTLGRWEEALRACQLGADVLADLGPTSADEMSRQQWLTESRGLAEITAGCHLTLGDPAAAVIAIERNKARRPTELLGRRAGTTELSRYAPELVERFVRIAEELEAGVDDSSVLAVVAKERPRLRREYDELLVEIRRRPHLSGFLRPYAYEEVVTAADRGPVVLFNLTDQRSDALVVRPTGTSVVPLPRLTPHSAAERVVELSVALEQTGRALAAGDAPAVTQAQKRVTDVLRWLWDAAVEPVAADLGLGTSDNRPRLWWIPSGPLWFLPLHAARPATGPGLLDLAVSSYTPSVQVLAQARERTPAAAAPRLLTVAMDRTPGAPPLPGAAAEAELTRSLFPGGEQLLNEEATNEHVVTALPGHSWVHVSCHSDANPIEPTLLLHDHNEHPFTARQLAGLVSADAQLSFLASCSTAQASPLATEEATHLAAAFAAAGFRHVVGTLWPATDVASTALADQFYRYLLDHPFDPALALDHAVRQLRQRYPTMPAVWATYVHLGP